MTLESRYVERLSLSFCKILTNNMCSVVLKGTSCKLQSNSAYHETVHTFRARKCETVRYFKVKYFRLVRYVRLADAGNSAEVPYF